MNGANISDASLLMASSLVLVSLLFSYFQKLRLEKETLISVIRAVIQLFAVGYVLQFIFRLRNPAVTTLIVLFMIFNAAFNAAKRGKGIKNGILISFLSILVGAGATLSVLVLSGAVRYEANQIIPISGMIISNAMVAIGLCYRQLTGDFKSRRNEVEIKLSLGADLLPASMDILRDSIRTGMVPTIDSTKTLGIVSLPGMMTGLILAGTSPLMAIRYQIMVTFMLLSTTAISSFMACFLSYRTFFNERKQLL
ncbi:iron export ABC transporter permease subunit FetB [Clostridium sp. W14A]|jgi:putative ABC transport system permease protein|uniref:Iron export ABC transporter permease subunit FetB n=1 Tax=Caproicibacterium amylolyticum TaxID=2766537 RepID=A0A7G9WFY8_9FIRM|nr:MULTISPECIES: iron export ABC transporter permease subunit FetB [Eubacteriales]MCI2036086.1 iron export ABC transporter permease subunit FetB [Oscillospiraceae bacterium]OCN00435.1 iron export ABC transporter permease subunit FetB [Clostridium sp. W14A]QNO17600.1 iron export ABC transporter permease subunit FetB [Caproicibacterium amylolyticum]